MEPAAPFFRVVVEAFAPLVDLIYPPRCPLCGAGIAAQRGVCASCWGDLVIPGQPACATCQRPFGAGGPDDGARCAPCLANPPVHDGIAAGTLYNDASRKLVLSFKHGGRIALAPTLARLIAARLPPLADDWTIVPVPLHRWRLWHRGYNQAALLAVEIGRMTGTPVVHAGLLRTRRTPSLGGLGKKARRRALSGALVINPRQLERIEGRRIVLVDDVLTSGATSDACVRVLKRHGARQVIVACFARVMDEALHANNTRGGGVLQTETPEV